MSGLVKEGRPTLFKPEYVEQVRELCLLGLVDEEIAKVWGVHVDTLNKWKKSHPELLEAMKEGREIADTEVVKSLYRRACGYRQRVVRAFQYRGEIITTEIEEEILPDVAAAKLWLNCRQPKRWRQNSVDIDDGALAIIINSGSQLASGWSPTGQIPGAPLPINEDEDGIEAILKEIPKDNPNKRIDTTGKSSKMNKSRS
jgi:hypothetical protein